MKVAIVGGGVMGCATALALAERGADVVVARARRARGRGLERRGRASWARRWSSTVAKQTRRSLLRARVAWAAWARELRDASGIDVGYRVSGVLRVARTDAEARGDCARGRVANASRAARRSCSTGRAPARVEPELAPDVRAAVHFADDAQVDPPALLRALMAASRAPSARRRPRRDDGPAAARRARRARHRRCVGVALDDGELRADATVLAAGSWSSLVPGRARDAPRGAPRARADRASRRAPAARAHHRLRRGGYVVPRGDGRVLCGSTMEHAGFRKEVTAGGRPRHPRQRARVRPVARRGAARGDLEQLPPARRRASAPLVGRVAARRGSSSRRATTATASSCRRSPPTCGRRPRLRRAAVYGLKSCWGCRRRRAWEAAAEPRPAEGAAAARCRRRAAAGACGGGGAPASPSTFTSAFAFFSLRPSPAVGRRRSERVALGHVEARRRARIAPGREARRVEVARQAPGPLVRCPSASLVTASMRTSCLPARDGEQ